MLLAQLRELDPNKRREIVHEIQRYLADKAYYIYLPIPPQYISHGREGLQAPRRLRARAAGHAHVARQVGRRPGGLA